MKTSRSLLAFVALVLMTSCARNAFADMSHTLYASRQGITDLSLYDDGLEWGTVTLDVGNGLASYVVDIYDSAVSSVYGEQEYYIHHFSFEVGLSVDVTNLSILEPTENWTIRSHGVDTFDGEIALYETPTSPFHSLSMVVNDVPLTAVDADFLEVNLLLQGNGFSTPWGVGLRFTNNNISGLPNTLYLYSYPAPYYPADPIPAPAAVLLGSIGLSFSGWMLRRKASH